MSIADKLTTIAENDQRVYEAGQKAEYDRFWDNFQNYGNLTNYQSAFGGAGWNDENFKPKYVPNIKMAALMFRETGIKNIVGLDFSKANDFQYSFYYAKVEYIDEISTISASRLYQTFDGCANLKTIGKLILKADGSQTITHAFRCSALENITVEGCFGVDISFSACTLLTHDSLISIINALKNYSGTTTTRTLTLGTTNLAKLTDEEKAIATEKGWTLA